MRLCYICYCDKLYECRNSLVSDKEEEVMHKGRAGRDTQDIVLHIFWMCVNRHPIHIESTKSALFQISTTLNQPSWKRITAWCVSGGRTSSVPRLTWINSDFYFRFNFEGFLQISCPILGDEWCWALLLFVTLLTQLLISCHCVKRDFCSFGKIHSCCIYSSKLQWITLYLMTAYMHWVYLIKTMYVTARDNDDKTSENKGAVCVRGNYL